MTDDELIAEAERLTDDLKAAREELADWREGAKRAAEEDCGVEKHCTCVPALRRQLKEALVDAAEAHDEAKAARAEAERLTSQRRELSIRAHDAEHELGEVRDYAVRLLHSLAPEVKPDDDLATVMTQLDNAIVGVRDAAQPDRSVRP